MESFFKYSMTHNGIKMQANKLPFKGHFRKYTYRSKTTIYFCMQNRNEILFLSCFETLTRNIVLFSMFKEQSLLKKKGDYRTCVINFLKRNNLLKSNLFGKKPSRGFRKLTQFSY